MRLFGHNGVVANALPVVSRELRAESRRATNFWLRVLAPAVVIGVFTGFVATTTLGASQLGAALFDVLYTALSLAIWVIAPIMTADCISREKREGTLGLLFLTPLTVLDVIIGKAATHVLRATTLLLASLPVLVLPFVLGGVAWQEVLVAIAMVANALLLGIAAGLYASAKGGTATQVIVMAEGYALAFAVISAIGHAACGVFAGPSLPALAWRLSSTLGLTLVIFVAAVQVSVRVLRQTWDQDSATPERPKWVRAFSGSEFWQEVFHWERGKTLDRNPMAWLQEYSWTARLTKWGWCLGALVAEFIVLLEFPGWQAQLTTVLALGVAFSATGSFRRERESGALETLLVTPLSVRQIILGRLWGMCGHFVPALIVLALCWNADRILNPREFHNNPFALVAPNPMAFGALMVVGLYMSLSLWRLNYLLVWLLAWVVVFFVPAFSAMLLGQFGGLPSLTIIAITSAFQMALALACWFLLNRDMEQRRFLNAQAG